MPHAQPLGSATIVLLIESASISEQLNMWSVISNDIQVLCYTFLKHVTLAPLLSIALSFGTLVSGQCLEDEIYYIKFFYI